MPEQFTDVGPEAFQGCVSLRLIKLPEQMIRIKYGTFRDCKGLKSVVINSTNASISPYAFSNCPTLKSVEITGDNTLSEGVFSNCSNLVSVSIPSLVDVPDWFFANCINLSSIDLPNIRNIGAFGFSGCKSLLSIDLPGVWSIGTRGFSNCIGLETLNFACITSIGIEAFQGCSSISMQDGVVEIADSVNGCLTIKHTKPLILKNGYVYTTWYTNYCHLNIGVADEAEVEKGQQIGTIGAVSADNFHLDFVISSKPAWSHADGEQSKSFAISPAWLNCFNFTKDFVNQNYSQIWLSNEFDSDYSLTNTRILGSMPQPLK